jgi:hypothetical protein
MTNTAYLAGSTDVTVYVRGFTASTGLPITTVTHATSGLTINQIRNKAAAVSITPVTQTAAGAHSDGGFVHVAGGLYRVDITDATVLTGADSAQVVVFGVTDVVFSVARFDILGADPRSAVADINNSIADAILNRDMATGTDSGSTTVRTVRQALRALRNRFVLSGGTVTVYKEDDATASFTAVVTGSPAVTQVNPAGGS